MGGEECEEGADGVRGRRARGGTVRSVDGAAEGTVEGGEDTVQAKYREGVGAYDDETTGERFALVLLLMPRLEEVVGCGEG